MRFVIKYPTRGRPAQFIRMMQKYRSMLSRHHPVRFVVSVDEDDLMMKSNQVTNYLRRQRDTQVFWGHSKGKIQAVNANFDQLGDYDVLILASDDMVPQVRHYDLIIERMMKAKFPGMDGCLHFSDGLNPNGLNTMPIAGRKLLDSWGYIYHPAYISEWCDNEFQEVTERDGKVHKCETVLFKHDWMRDGADATHARNAGFSSADHQTFLRRKAAGFPKEEIAIVPTVVTPEVIPAPSNGVVLSILVCSLPERARFLTRLNGIIRPQMIGKPVEMLVDDRGRGVTIGAKRNSLLSVAGGQYVAFIDDDDLVSPNYISLILEALKTRPDCVGMNGIITFDGKNPKNFVHTVECSEWCERDGVYYRHPNHLSPIRRDLALKAGFPEINFGEDHSYSNRVKPFLKTEVMVKPALYFYLSRSVKPEMCR